MSGVWFLQAVIDRINGDQTSYAQYISLIQGTFASVNTAIVEGKSKSADGLEVNECTLDTGMAGMLSKPWLRRRLWCRSRPS